MVEARAEASLETTRLTAACGSPVVARRQGFYAGTAGFGLRLLPGFPAAASVV
jgi:hypothetical protein